jgi:putative addiction module CopG family antidote
VSLTPELQRFVAERVASGLYRSANEVVRAALRLLEQERGRWLSPQETDKVPLRENRYTTTIQLPYLPDRRR